MNLKNMLQIVTGSMFMMGFVQAKQLSPENKNMILESRQTSKDNFTETRNEKNDNTFYFYDESESNKEVEIMGKLPEVIYVTY